MSVWFVNQYLYMAAGAKTNCANGYQSTKYGSLPKEAEISPDLHLKMCKKIAQLTKVSA